MTLLPTEKQQKSSNPFDYTILLYGDPKIGKSEACSRIPDALFIQTEAGLKNLDVCTTPLIDSWNQFLEIAGEIAEGRHNFKTIVVDTIDGLYQICARHICQLNGWKHESDLDFGKGYARVRLELMRVLNKLSALPTGLVLVGHAKEKEVKTRTAKYDRMTVCFSGSIEEAITAFVDVGLYARVETIDGEKVRVVRSLHSDDYFAGGRINFFKDGMLLEDLFKPTTTKGGSK
jgi:hypothetical protein